MKTFRICPDCHGHGVIYYDNLTQEKCTKCVLRRVVNDESAPALLEACERWVNASQVCTYIPERERPAWDELMAATTTAIKLAKEGQ